MAIYNPVQQLEAGKYFCQVEKCSEAKSKLGDDMWLMDLRCVKGKGKGLLITDRLYFNSKGMMRVKWCFRACGMELPEDNSVILKPEHLLRKTCWVEVENRDRKIKDRDTGEDRMMNFTGVAFRGYSSDAEEQNAWERTPDPGSKEFIPDSSSKESSAALCAVKHPDSSSSEPIPDSHDGPEGFEADWFDEKV